MRYNNIKNIILTVLFGFMAFTSCIDDDYMLSGGEDYDIPEGIREGYSINLIATLDKMGGTRADNAAQLEEMENYIDPEKFRVLFFDSKDTLLFESKSRWVKKLNPGAPESEWLISVPVFTYGNDVYEVDDGNGGKKTIEWDWEYIREKLTSESFKIAILANRPELDYYPKLSGIKIGAHWYDNSAPYWTPEHTGKVDVFDLHHCQYDPMYHGKSATDLNKEESEKYGGLGIGFYDFLMKDWEHVTDKDDAYYAMKPKMGATASWVEHIKRKLLPEDSPYDMRKGKDDNGVVVDRDYPYAILPSYEHPIPMYGIQKFDPITTWTKGTPFNVSDLIGGENEDVLAYDFRTIPLLRSVVRLDLLIPKASYPEEPGLVGLWYPNVYSRCEPMDVWTPTELIWKEHENLCEWNDIMNYGLIVSANEDIGGTTTKGTTNRKADNKFDFQNTISWFYGAWKDKKWPFKNNEGVDLTPIDLQDDPRNISYPRIFNPCVQRNKFVICSIPNDPDTQGNVTAPDDDYWHFVAYTGERNMIDVNRIPLQNAQTSYTVTWMFKDSDRDQYFCIPIADYSKPQQYATECFGPYKNEDWDGSSNLPKESKNNERKATTKILKYADTLRDNVPAKGESFQDSKFAGEEPRDEMPWPLLRNHIYRITVTGPSPDKLTEPHTWDFTQYPDAKTVFNLNTDKNWTNPNDLNTSGYVVSWNEEPTLSINNSSTVDNVANVATWSNGYSITKNLAGAPSTAVTSAISSGSNVSINNVSYKTIKTSADVENILKLPDGKTTKKIRLYSYINVDYNFSAKTKSGSKLSIKEGETKRIQNEATIAGGKLYATNATTGKTDDWEAVGSSGFYLWANDAFFKIELEYPLAVGDVISATVSEDGKGFYITSEDRKHPGVGNGIWPYIIKSSNSYTITTEDDPLVGKDIIYLYRYTASGTHFNDFKVTRKNLPVTNQSYWSEVNGKEYGAEDKGINNYLSGSTMHEFTFEEAVNEVKFTNTGKQLCYVIWVEVGDPVEYWQLSKPNGEIKANKKYVPNLQGLRFVSDGSISIYDTDPSKIRLSTNNATITFPEIKPGLIVSIKGQSPNATATNRGIAPANDNLVFYSGPRSNNDECIFYGAEEVPENHKTQVKDKNIYTFKWKVIDNSGNSETVPVSFNIINGGIDFYEFSIEDPDGVSNAPSRASVNSEPSIMIKSEDLHSKSIKFSSR